MTLVGACGSRQHHKRHQCSQQRGAWGVDFWLEQQKVSDERRHCTRLHSSQFTLALDCAGGQAVPWLGIDSLRAAVGSWLCSVPSRQWRLLYSSCCLLGSNACLNTSSDNTDSLAGRSWFRMGGTLALHCRTLKAYNNASQSTHESEHRLICRSSLSRSHHLEAVRTLGLRGAADHGIGRTRVGTLLGHQLCV